MIPAWRFDLDRLEDHFDHRTLTRARILASDGSIVQVRMDGVSLDGLEARALAHGSTPTPYAVQLSIGHDAHGTDVSTSCSCPMAWQCKHGAALTLLVRGALYDSLGSRSDDGGGGLATASDPGPIRALDDLLDELSALVPDTEIRPAVALEFSLGRATAARGGTRFGGRGGATTAPDRLHLRPLRPGIKQRWVRSGLGWPDVAAALARREYDPDALRALSRLQAALTAHAGPWYAGLGDPTLDEFGPAVVPLLREAVEAGVTIVTAGGVGSIELWPEPVHLHADATTTGADTTIRVGLELDGRLVSGDSVTAYGRPAHTASIRDDERWIVVGLDPPLDPGPLRALARAEPVAVPASSADLGDRLLRLSRSVPVGSSDASVTLPELPMPRLRVTVAWQSAALADVDWAWCYAEHPPFGLDATPPAAVIRDRAAERALLAAVTPPPDPAHRRAEGADVLHLALLELPSWRAVDGLEVVELDAPDFREAEEAPQISFEAVATSPSPAAAAAGTALNAAEGSEGSEDSAGLEGSEGSRGSGGVPAAAPVPARTDWLDLEVQISIEGEPVLLAAVVEALTLGLDHLVLPSGLFVRTDRPEFARLDDVVRAATRLPQRPTRKDRPDGAAPASTAGSRVRVGRDDLGLWAQLADLGEVDPEAAAWVQRALALRDLLTLPTPDPVGVVSTLRPYQLDGFHWLAFLHQHGLGGVLADDMGLGKTLQVLALIAHARAGVAVAGAAPTAPFLVVAPTSVVAAWAQEAARHTPGLVVHTVTASGRRRETPIAESAAVADVVVTSYTLLRLEAEAYAAQAWSGLVLDEAQNVKNHQSKAYAAVRSISAPFRLAVTGTPFENRLLELWSLPSFLAPGLYPQARTFTEHVVRPVEKQADSAALGRFTRRIKPFVLRRTKEAVATDLPPKQEQVLAIELTPGHRRLYDTHLAKERQRILGLVEDFDHNRVAILAALTKLRQLALDPALLDADHEHLGSAKLDSLVEQLRELATEGHRALVFSSFTGFLRRVRTRLETAGLEVAYLDGSTRERGAVIDEFRTGSATAFLISLKAGGVGLTLTEADYVFVLDPWWNPAAEAQAVDRAHRIGQQRTVMVYRMVSTETIEEKVMELKARKAALFAQVIDGEAGLAETVSADDIRGLFE